MGGGKNVFTYVSGWRASGSHVIIIIIFYLPKIGGGLPEKPKLIIRPLYNKLIWEYNIQHTYQPTNIQSKYTIAHITHWHTHWHKTIIWNEGLGSWWLHGNHHVPRQCIWSIRIWWCIGPMTRDSLSAGWHSLVVWCTSIKLWCHRSLSWDAQCRAHSVRSITAPCNSSAATTLHCLNGGLQSAPLRHIAGLHLGLRRNELQRVINIIDILYVRVTVSHTNLYSPYRNR